MVTQTLWSIPIRSHTRLSCQPTDQVIPPPSSSWLQKLYRVFDILHRKSKMPSCSGLEFMVVGHAASPLSHSLVYTHDLSRFLSLLRSLLLLFPLSVCGWCLLPLLPFCSRPSPKVSTAFFFGWALSLSLDSQFNISPFHKNILQSYIASYHASGINSSVSPSSQSAPQEIDTPGKRIPHNLCPQFQHPRTKSLIAFDCKTRFPPTLGGVSCPSKTPYQHLSASRRRPFHHQARLEHLHFSPTQPQHDPLIDMLSHLFLLFIDWLGNRSLNR